jgi:hypothetical protein
MIDSSWIVFNVCDRRYSVLLLMLMLRMLGCLFFFLLWWVVWVGDAMARACALSVAGVGSRGREGVEGWFSDMRV